MRKVLKVDQSYFPMQIGRGGNHVEIGDSSSTGIIIQNIACLISQFAQNKNWKINSVKKDFLIIIRTENTTLE